MIKAPKGINPQNHHPTQPARKCPLHLKSLSSRLSLSSARVLCPQITGTAPSREAGTRILGLEGIQWESGKEVHNLFIQSTNPLSQFTPFKQVLESVKVIKRNLQTMREQTWALLCQDIDGELPVHWNRIRRILYQVRGRIWSSLQLSTLLLLVTLVHRCESS